MGILRSHQEEVTNDVKLLLSMGSSALVVKGKKTVEEDYELDLSESEISKEDKALLVSNPKKFYKKNFSRYRNKLRQGNSSSENPRDDIFKNFDNDDEKKEKNTSNEKRALIVQEGSDDDG